jgi:hypothetical protein
MKSIAAGLLLSGVVLTGCGDDKSSSSITPESTTTTISDAEFCVELRKTDTNPTSKAEALEQVEAIRKLQPTAPLVIRDHIEPAVKLIEVTAMYASSKDAKTSDIAKFAAALKEAGKDDNLKAIVAIEAYNSQKCGKTYSDSDTPAFDLRESDIKQFDLANIDASYDKVKSDVNKSFDKLVSDLEARATIATTLKSMGASEDEIDCIVSNASDADIEALAEMSGEEIAQAIPSSDLADCVNSAG